MGSFVQIATLQDAIEASFVSSLLTERSVPHLVESFHDSAYDGLFQLQKGWGCVLAEEQRREAVERAVEEARAAREQDTPENDAPAT